MSRKVIANEVVESLPDMKMRLVQRKQALEVELEKTIAVLQLIEDIGDIEFASVV